MKKGKILSLILAIVSTVTFAGGMVSCDKGNEERNGEVVILSDNAVDDAENEKIKVLNEYNFDLGESNSNYERLIMKENKLYLESLDENGEIKLTEEIEFQEKSIKKEKRENFESRFDLENTYFMNNGYDTEILENDKMRIFNDKYKKEIIVNLNNFNNGDFVESLKYEKFLDCFVLEDYIVNIQRRRINSKDELKYGTYSEIRWYDLGMEEWNIIEVPKDIFLTSHILGEVDNKLFVAGENSKDSQFSNKIYSLDLENKELKDEIDFEVEGEVYYSFVPLSKEKILVCLGSEEGQQIRMLDLRNKVPIYLCNGVIENTIWHIYESITSSKDKFFYGIENGENIDIRVIGLGNTGVSSEGKVYEYDKNNKDEYGNILAPKIIWSEDGKYLIIGEMAEGEMKFSNLKILELNQ